MMGAASRDLEAMLQRRVADCRRFAGDADLSGDHQLALVVSRLDLAAIVRGTLRLCGSLSRGAARPWAGNFTKCLVLAGDPRKLAARFPLAHVDGEGTVAWVGPRPARELEALRRLLRPLKTIGPLDLGGVLADVVVAICDASSRHAAVTLATGGLRLEEYLVGLVHTLAETALLGHLDEVGEVAIRHARVLEVIPPDATYARVHKGKPGDPPLRLYSTVTASLA